MTTKSYAKVNIFLKITGTRGEYHTILSRFVKVDDLYDNITFKKKSLKDNQFTIDGEFSCKTNKNSIYKAYRALLKKSKKVESFFKEYKVVVDKNIPEFAGLGGGSSNAASFLELTNRVLDLNLSLKTLADIGSLVGSDVPFFIYNYQSANVSGVGEVVEPFYEEPIRFEIFTPQIKCDTAKVYKRFNKLYLDRVDQSHTKELLNMDSKEIVKNFNADELNDLLAPSITLYSELQEYNRDGWFFSGSGSTFFRIIDG